ncbi:MAG: serine/threonine-protein kinase, partial [Myxococcota bacterium]
MTEARGVDAVEPGRVYDRWIVLDRIGQGGTASVYRVRHLDLGLVAALKVVATPSRALIDRLRLEGRVMSRIRHPNIVGVRDVLDVEGAPGLLMDWIAGPTLDSLLGGPPLGRLALDQIDALARGILRGMIAVHEAGLIHRDLKPSNILVAVEDGALVAKVADFGLAKDLVAGPNTTRTGMMFGTPSYMSPEQIRDPKTVDVRSDVFSLGVVLYELVTGARAFPGDDILDVLTRVAEVACPPVRTLRPDVPERMARAISLAMQARREDRPSSCAELLGLWIGDAEAAVPTYTPSFVAHVAAMASKPPPSPVPFGATAAVGDTVSEAPPGRRSGRGWFVA